MRVATCRLRLVFHRNSCLLSTCENDLFVLRKSHVTLPAYSCIFLDFSQTVSCKNRLLFVKYNNLIRILDQFAVFDHPIFRQALKFSDKQHSEVQWGGPVPRHFMWSSCYRVAKLYCCSTFYNHILPGNFTGIQERSRQRRWSAARKIKTGNHFLPPRSSLYWLVQLGVPYSLSFFATQMQIRRESFERDRPGRHPSFFRRVSCGKPRRYRFLVGRPSSGSSRPCLSYF